MADRQLARRLAAESCARSDPIGWFEELYRASEGTPDAIPWADQVPNPHLVRWFAKAKSVRRGERALVVGAGLGDDAEFLASEGLAVTAFDIAPSASAWSRARFPDMTVEYCTADLFDAPPEWTGAFGFVFEAYTLQVLPPDLREAAARCIARFVGVGGQLLVVARGRDEADDVGSMPWPLTRQELGAFARSGLREQAFEDFMDDEAPPVRRFVAAYVR